MTATEILQHHRRNTTGIRTIAELAKILATQRDRGTLQRALQLRQIRIRGTNRAFHAVQDRKRWHQIFQQDVVSGQTAIHLPVACNELDAHFLFGLE